MTDAVKNRDVIVVYGVSGCGKTTIAKLLSEKLSVPYYDADDFHPEANVEKMRNGIALNDHDRKPWLETLAAKIKEWDAKGGAVLACSALKEKYREMLEAKVEHIHWVLLYGSFELIKSRLEARKAHYMNPSLLQSQFETLETPEYGLKISVETAPEQIADTIITKLHAHE